MLVLPRLIQDHCYVVLDLETTGISSKSDEPVQIAFGHVDHGRVGLRGFYTVKPRIAIKEAAAQVHGITEEKVEHAPQFEAIARDLYAHLDQRIVLGYNVRTFDVAILRRMFDRAGFGGVFQPRVLDVLRWTRRLFPGMRHNLGAMAEVLGVEVGPRHDAWHDCRLVWSVFAQMALRFPEAFGDLDIENVIENEQGVYGAESGGAPKNQAEDEVTT